MIIKHPKRISYHVYIVDSRLR